MLPTTESKSWLTRTSQGAVLGGSSVGGATSVTSAPSLVKTSMSDRATRECLTSPTIEMRTPSSEPRCDRSV